MPALLFSLLLAALFWVVTFSLKLFNFWLSMSIAVTTLTILALRFGGMPWRRKDWNWRAIFSGIAAASAGIARVLFGLFLILFVVSFVFQLLQA